MPGKRGLAPVSDPMANSRGSEGLDFREQGLTVRETAGLSEAPLPLPSCRASMGEVCDL